MSILRKNRYKSLDGWRGIAALMIVFYRFEGEGYFYHLPLIRNAYLFVDYFFVLSGFVIAHTYFQRIRAPSDLVGFMIRRFGRLWPLHAGLFALFFMLESARWVLHLKSDAGAEAFSGFRAPGTIPVELFFLNDFHFYTQTGWNLPSWSITAEFWVYLAFGALCLFARRAIVPIAMIIVPLFLVLILRFSPSGMDVTFDYGLLRGFAGFFAGFLVNRVWNVVQIESLGPRWVASLIELACLAILVAYVSVVDLSPLSIAAPIVFAPMIWIFAFEGGVVSSWLKSPFIKWLGRLSYSIYMVAFLTEMTFSRAIIGAARRSGHEITRDILVEGVPRQVFDLGHPLLNDAVLVIYVIAVIAISRLTYRILELPARHYFNTIAKRMRRARAGIVVGQVE